MDWTTLRNSAEGLPRYSIDAIKQELPIAYVLEQYGCPIENINGKLVTHCPFHADRNPSMDVYEKEGQQRVGCYPCGFNGDVLDLIGKFDNTNLNSTLVKAGQLLDSFRGTEWLPKVAESRPRIEATVVADKVFEIEKNSLELLRQMIDRKGWPVDADWLRETFSVGVDGEDIVIPYQDYEGQWSGYKIRRGIDKTAAPGSKFDALYGHWLDQGRETVVITEGEPDTWAALASIGYKYDVLGLPSGAGTHPKDSHIDRLRDRHIILGFDGDHAGREGTRKWATAAQGVARSIRILPMADGHDLSMLTNLDTDIEKARPRLPYTGNIHEYNGILSRILAKGNAEPVCNWNFTPEKELIIEEGGIAYEGMLSSGKRVVLTSDDLSSGAKMYSWSQHHSLGWRGTDKDARDILIWLESEGPFLSPGRMTKVLGLHEKHFVLPNATIGKDRWIFLSKPGIVTKHLNFDQKSNWSSTLENLFELHQPFVIDPIVSWLAAAPVRSLIDEFPILAVTGGSGAGKTTLLKTLLTAFSGGALGGKDGISLADTTKHAITENAGATNAIPVWFDEYRASIKADTRDALHNTLLASYIGQTTSKGSVTDRGLGVSNWEHYAPIIISGESTFAETAHVERMVMLGLPLEGKNPKALMDIQSELPSGISEAYLHWLIYRYDLPERFSITPTGPEHLPSRTRTNLGVLTLGWRLLSEFLFDTVGVDLKQPDYSLAIAEADEAASEDPILEAVRWAIENADIHLGEPLVVLTGDQAFIRVEALVAEVFKTRRFALPGNAKAVRRVLIEKYLGVEIQQAMGIRFKQPTKFIRLSLAILGF